MLPTKGESIRREPLIKGNPFFYTVMSDPEPSDSPHLILVELTPDELDYINQMRAIYGEIVAGETWSGKPAYLDTIVETPDKKIIIKYHPLSTSWEEYSKTRSKNKKSYGIIRVGKSRLELYRYFRPKNKNSVTCNDTFVSLNGQKIALNKDLMRNLWRIVMRVINDIGIFGRKRRKK